MTPLGMNTPQNDAEEEAVFEAWRKSILAKEEARTIRRRTPRIQRDENGCWFRADTDLAAENGCWSPSGQSMKHRFLNL